MGFDNWRELARVRASSCGAGRCCCRVHLLGSVRVRCGCGSGCGFLNEISPSAAAASWDSFTPTSGYASGGQLLTFTGTNFVMGYRANYQCVFSAGTQSVASTSRVFVSGPTTVVCESPSWPFAIPGNKAVTLSLRSGTSAVASTSRSSLFYIAGTLRFRVLPCSYSQLFLFPPHTRAHPLCLNRLV